MEKSTDNEHVKTIWDNLNELNGESRLENERLIPTILFLECSQRSF